MRIKIRLKSRKLKPKKNPEKNPKNKYYIEIYILHGKGLTFDIYQVS